MAPLDNDSGPECRLKEAGHFACNIVTEKVEVSTFVFGGMNRHSRVVQSDRRNPWNYGLNRTYRVTGF